MAKDVPDAIILSGPDFYEAHIARLYGGYKRTQNLYGRATYQKDPAQVDAERNDAYIYFSLADRKWCVGTQLGACINQTAENQRLPFVLMYQAAGTEADQTYPNLRGSVSWAVNMTGLGANYQFDHLLFLEPLQLPAEAADPKSAYGGYMHILVARSVDYEFPPSLMSLVGDVPPVKSEEFRYGDITWCSGGQALAKLPSGAPLLDANNEPNAKDFVGLSGTNPSEVTITRSVLASLREYPGYVEALLAQTPSTNEAGKYCVQLFDMWQRRWRYIGVDDFMPVRAFPKGGRHWAGGAFYPLWVMLLEKALAKLSGSYEALRGSHHGALLMALTGQTEKLQHWRKDKGWWSAWRHVLPGEDSAARWGQSHSPGLHRRVTKLRPLRCFLHRIGGTWHQNEDFMLLLRELQRQNALLLAWIFPGELGMDEERLDPREDPRGNGLVQGHGYSILDFLVEDALYLVQLRNIWGSKTWRGAWAEDSKEWIRFPDVHRHVFRREHKSAGRFWMSWTDFCEIFDEVEVCPMDECAKKASHMPPKLQIPRRTGSRSGTGSFLGLWRWDCCDVQRA